MLAPNSFLHCTSVSPFECVSCKNTISAFFLRHQVKTVRLFQKLVRALTLSDIKVNVSEIKIYIVNTGGSIEETDL